MHLTNYSLNKKNDKYVRCDDPDIEDYGNKWSMSALLRFLKSQGKDTFNLMMQIEETIIKTLLSVESPLASAARMFIPFKGNCFGKINYLFKLVFILSIHFYIFIKNCLDLIFWLTTNLSRGY